MTNPQAKFSYIILCMLVVTGVSSWAISSPSYIDEVQAQQDTTKPTSTQVSVKRVVVHLDTMSVSLKNGTTTYATLPILSQGKPGSYYETIGGLYISDYKTPLHFSSIGHVFMPYSVHVFGNYFIHGVPYHPDGTQVSSAYSGGCVRLSNEDAQRVYDFVEPGTELLITKDTEASFDNTQEASTTMDSITMTNLMSASISLETLTQDSQITDTDGIHTTTRKALLPRLVLSGDTSISSLYARDMGEDVYLDLMNRKAAAIGMKNTHFTNLHQPVQTTYDDYIRFMTYIHSYKSYLETLSFISAK